jgi:hypothetical protein
MPFLLSSGLWTYSYSNYNIPFLFWVDIGHVATVITVHHFCFEWTLRMQLQELQYPIPVLSRQWACNCSNYGTLFLFLSSHKTINMKASYLEVKDIYNSQIYVYDICFYTWSYICTTHSCWENLCFHLTCWKIMIYIYMACWCISGCCAFKGCQILGHCEAILTIQQCFPCSNVVTLKKNPLAEYRLHTWEWQYVFWSFMCFGIEYSRTWRCISDCSELKYSRSTENWLLCTICRYTTEF